MQPFIKYQSASTVPLILLIILFVGCAKEKRTLRTKNFELVLKSEDVLLSAHFEKILADAEIIKELNYEKSNSSSQVTEVKWYKKSNQKYQIIRYESSILLKRLIVGDHFQVVLRKSVSEDSLNSFLENSFFEKRKKLGKSNQYLISFPLDQIGNEKQLQQTLLDTGLFEEIFQDIYHEPTLSLNDPLVSQMWGHKRARVIKAWDVEDCSNSQVVIGIMDDGVNFNHPDLQPNQWVNTAELNGLSGVDDDANGYVDDTYGWDFSIDEAGTGKNQAGHGTPVAGVAAAKGNNSIGVAGVCPHAKILSLTTAFYTSAIAEAALYFIQNVPGPKVVNTSFVGKSLSGNLPAYYSSFVEMKDSGVVIISAAGNDGIDNDKVSYFPSNFGLSTQITVGALHESGFYNATYWHSNYGKTKVDLAAPTDNQSTFNDGSYAAFSGTSSATPFVSGVAALVWTNLPNLTAIEVRNRIVNTVTPNGALEEFVSTAGEVDAWSALQGVSDTSRTGEGTLDCSAYEECEQRGWWPGPTYKPGDFCVGSSMALYKAKIETGDAPPLVGNWDAEGYCLQGNSGVSSSTNISSIAVSSSESQSSSSDEVTNLLNELPLESNFQLRQNILKYADVPRGSNYVISSISGEVVLEGAIEGTGLKKLNLPRGNYVAQVYVKDRVNSLKFIIQ